MRFAKKKPFPSKRNDTFRTRFNERFQTRRRLKAQTLTGMLPNILTLIALCCGMTAIRFALLEMWHFAIVSVLLSAILDGLDGRLARLLNITSRFGAELDSFSDFLCFGAAPALIMYLNGLQKWGELGWAICLFFTICTVLRLARFNIMLDDLNQPNWMKGFFTGVPAPIGGFFCLFPLILTFALPNRFLFESPFTIAFFMIFSATLMVSRIPTFSLKRLVIAPIYVLPFLLILFIIIGMLYSYPWQTLSILGMFYLLSIPFSIKSYNKYKKKDSFIPLLNKS